MNDSQHIILEDTNNIEQSNAFKNNVKPIMIEDSIIWKNAVSFINNTIDNKSINVPKGIIQKLKYLSEQIDHKAIFPYDIEINAFNSLESVDRLLTTRLLFVTDAHLISPKEINKIKVSIFFNITLHLELITNKSVCNEENNRMIDIFNYTLSTIIKSVINNQYCITLDIFDHLYTKDYVFIDHQDPFEISQQSKIELIGDKKNFLSLDNYLKTHPLVDRLAIIIKVNSKKYHVFLKDKSIFEIDINNKTFIGATQLIDTNRIISKAQKNEFGIRVPRRLCLARYIGRTYSIRNEAVPAQYLYLRNDLLCGSDRLDQEIYLYFSGDKSVKKKIIKLMNNKPYNSNLKKLSNNILFIIDELYNFNKKKVFNNTSLIH